MEKNPNNYKKKQFQSKKFTKQFICNNFNSAILQLNNTRAYSVKHSFSVSMLERRLIN